MGYCCTPFRIDFDVLNEVRGSRHAALLERIGAHITMLVPEVAGPRPPLVARLRAWASGDGDDRDPGVAARRVLHAARQIVDGSRLSAARAAEYADALNAICWVLGSALDNAEVAPAPPAHFTAVDAVLRERGLYDRVSMSQLGFGGPPLDLPATDDCPMVGHMPPRMVAAAHCALAGLDWSGAPGDLQPTLRLLSVWMEQSSAHGQGIVCFYA